MDAYRPVAKRGTQDVDLDTLHEDVMPWMVPPMRSWLARFVWKRNINSITGTNMEFVEGFEMASRRRTPFARGDVMATGRDLIAKIGEGGQLGLDVAEYALVRRMSGQRIYRSDVDKVEQLSAILRESGSVWDVLWSDDGDKLRARLIRRDLATAKEAIRAVESETGAEFLTMSWFKIAGRDPDPDGAYDYAIKAVEAAAHDVVSPDNARATLGTMIRDLSAKTDKWNFALADMSTIIVMADALWTNHFRHGTQERGPHTLEEADAAVHMAIPLVRYFSGGLVARA